ncbi:MAG: cyclase family protein [Pseudomonadota bacterium]
MRWKNRPEGSNWGDFGPDDQVGRLNLLGPEQVKKGVAEVKEGRTFCLSMPLDYPGGNILNPARHPPQRFATRSPDGTDRYLLAMADAQKNAELTDVVNDDRVMIHTQYSSQWDALAHVGGLFDADGDGVPEKVFYNGWRGGEHIVERAPSPDYPGLTATEATRLGIETMAETCIQGRAVMIDLHAEYGEAHEDVGLDGLEGVMSKQGVQVEKGDLVMLHTGWTKLMLDMEKTPSKEMLHASCTALEGRDPKLQDWIRDSGLVALISDNYAVERAPSRTGAGRRPMLPIHELCLFKLGIPLAEIWWLGDLAAYFRESGRNRCLLTAPPLRLPGAVGSPVMPVATV